MICYLHTMINSWSKCATFHMTSSFADVPLHSVAMFLLLQLQLPSLMGSFSVFYWDVDISSDSFCKWGITMSKRTEFKNLLDITLHHIRVSVHICLYAAVMHADISRWNSMHILIFIFWMISCHMESICESGNHREHLQCHLYTWNRERGSMAAGEFIHLNCCIKIYYRPFLFHFCDYFSTYFQLFNKSICWCFTFTNCSCVLSYL